MTYKVNNPQGSTINHLGEAWCRFSDMNFFSDPPDVFFGEIITWFYRENIKKIRGGLIDQTFFPTPIKVSQNCGNWKMLDSIHSKKKIIGPYTALRKPQPAVKTLNMKYPLSLRMPLSAIFFVEGLNEFYLFFASCPI